MAWAVRLPDGTDSEPFETAAEAEAYGEEITAAGGVTPEEIWEAATAPRVDRATFMRRMAMGWKPHRALHTQPGGRYTGVYRSAVAAVDALMGGRNAELHEMWGRKRTIKDWSLSSRIPEDAIRKGIERHGSLPAYFTHVGWYPSKPAQPGDPDITDDRWTTP